MMLVMGKIQSAIVFVHIGPTIPPYLYVALEQARLFNPEEEVCLITNQQALDSSSHDFSQHAITTVPCENLVQTPEHQKFIQTCPHSASILNGFWRKAIERFFYLHEYIAARNLKHVIHLESDNMLYIDIALIKEALAEYKGIGAVFDADNRCIPSFVYIANEQAIAHMIQFIADYASHGHTDMGLLSLYRHKNSDKIACLPLIMPEYLIKHTLINTLGQRPIEASLYYNKCAQFNSIFDGAAFGQYLGGIDPNVHAHSQPGFINETCVFNPSYLRFEWRKDEQGRKVPFALCEGAAYRINNLHIHSKRLHDFRS